MKDIDGISNVKQELKMIGSELYFQKELGI